MEIWYLFQICNPIFKTMWPVFGDMMKRDCNEVTSNTLKFLWLKIYSCSTGTDTLQMTVTILLTSCWQLSNSIEQNPSEANSSSIIHKIRSILWILKVYHHATLLTTVCHLPLSYAKLLQSTPSHPISLRSILILSYHLGLKNGNFSSRFPTKLLRAFSSPCMPHAPPISSSLIW